MRSRSEELRARIRAAVVSLCQEDAFYLKELRIEGTLCIVSDRTSVLVTQITEKVGEVLKQTGEEILPSLELEEDNPLGLAHSYETKHAEEALSSSPDDALSANARVENDDGILDKSQKPDTDQLQPQRHQLPVQDYELLRGATPDSDDLITSHTTQPQSCIISPSVASAPQIHVPEGSLSENFVPDVIRINGRYKCPFCDKSYHLKRSAKAHLASHLYVKHYRCKACPAKFASPSSLSTHERRHHAGVVEVPVPASTAASMQAVFRLLQCDACGERCMDVEALREHYLKCHKEKALPILLQHTALNVSANSPSHLQPFQLVPQNAAAHQLLIQSAPAQLLTQSIPAHLVAQSTASAHQHEPLLSQTSMIPHLLPAGINNQQLLNLRVDGSQSNDAGAIGEERHESAHSPSPHGMGMASLSEEREEEENRAGRSSAAALDVVMKSIFPDHISEEELKSDALLHTDDDNVSVLHQAMFSEDTSKQPESDISPLGSYSSPDDPLVPPAGDNPLDPLFGASDIASPYVNSFQSPESTSLNYDAPLSPGHLGSKTPSPGLQAALMKTSSPSGIVRCDTTTPFINENSSNSLSTPLGSFSTSSSSDLASPSTLTSTVADTSPPPPFNINNLPPTPPTPPNQPQPPQSTNSEIRPLIAEFFEEINLKTERGTYKFRCRNCSNMFKVRNTLYEHINSHLGRKPFTCKHCSQSFAHHSSLYNHVRNKHTFANRAEKEAQFKHKCLTCPKRFEFPSSLDRHYSKCPSHAIKAIKVEREEGEGADLEI